MKPINKLCTIAFFIALISIEYLATTQIQIKPLENTWDKTNHLFAFFVLFLLLVYSHFKLKVFAVFSILFLYAVQIEVVQYFIPNRYFSLLDILADCLGLLLGYFVYLIIQKRYNYS